MYAYRITGRSLILAPIENTSHQLLRATSLLVIFQHNIILASLLALLLLPVHFAQSNWFDPGETLETFTSWLYLA